MARTTKPLRSGRGGRTARSVSASAGRKAKAAGARRTTAASAPAAPPKVSKGELREQVAALEAANARLRARNREFGRAAKAAAARVAELEDRLAALEQLQRAQAATGPGTRRTRRRAIDPGDAVPPGVAVQTPEEPDAEARAVQALLEERLSD